MPVVDSGHRCGRSRARSRRSRCLRRPGILRIVTPALSPAIGETGGIVRSLSIMPRLDSAYRGWDLLVSPWHLDEQIDEFPAPAGAIALVGPPDPASSELDRLTGRFRNTADAVAHADRPLVLAGDCLTALGLAAGLQRRQRDLSVIWLDAHGDFNTPAISVSGYLAGMSLAMPDGSRS